MIPYLEDNVLPWDNKKAHELILGRLQNVLNNDVLYGVEIDKTLRVVVPENDHKDLFMKVHAREFGGHLKEAKIHSEVSHHYCWPSTVQGKISPGGTELASPVPAAM